MNDDSKHLSRLSAVEFSEPSHPDNNIEVNSNDNNGELSFAMEEVELVIAYLCRTSGEVDQLLIKSCLQARSNFLADGYLSSSAQGDFWYDYHQLINAIKPATLTSIEQTNPSLLWKQKHPEISRQVKRVPVFYGFVVCLLILFTVSLQTYYVIGVDVLQKTHDLFSQREEIGEHISRIERLLQPHVNSTENDNETQQNANDYGDKSEEHRELELSYQDVEQELNANRTLLFRWNAVWQLGENHHIEFTKHEQHSYLHQIDNATVALAAAEQQSKGLVNSPSQQQDIMAKRQALHEIKQTQRLHESRFSFFSARLQAVYVVNLLESYLLPMLFGCLGAFTLVLRSIHTTFQNGTFTLKNCLDYNLRIVLGGVTGISSGMLFGESQIVPQGQFSPMLLAFFIGYNVEILFSIMDDIANRLAISSKNAAAQSSDKTSEGPTQASKLSPNINT